MESKFKKVVNLRMGSYHLGTNFFKAHNYLSNRNFGPSLVFHYPYNSKTIHCGRL
jgi:hypothetical protein